MKYKEAISLLQHIRFIIYQYRGKDYNKDINAINRVIEILGKMEELDEFKMLNVWRSESRNRV